MAADLLLRVLLMGRRGSSRDDQVPTPTRHEGPLAAMSSSPTAGLSRRPLMEVFAQIPDPRAGRGGPVSGRTPPSAVDGTVQRWEMMTWRRGDLRDELVWELDRHGMTLAVPSATLVTSVTRVTAGQPPWLPTLPTPWTVIDCSNMFYSSPLNILRPDRAHIMGDGWENARRRDKRQRPRDGPAGRPRIRAAGRDRYLLFHRQFRRLGIVARDRYHHSGSRGRCVLDGAGAEDKVAARHPAFLRPGNDSAGDARAARRVPRRRTGPAAGERGDRSRDPAQIGRDVSIQPARRPPASGRLDRYV